MAIGITGKFKPEGDYPLMDAEDIEMPDGTRLSEFDPSDLPEITEADNGKFLQAVDGKWVCVDAVPQVTAIVENYINEALGGEY